MRRSEFSSESQEEYDEITNQALDGHLGLVDNKGYPRLVPLNFVAYNGSIYVHGARHGEKYELCLKEPRATFSVSIPYSYIPSYFKSEKYACPATQFFKSIHIRGRASVVKDKSEKSEALTAMMKKYQPEGRFIEITADNPIYKNALEEVAVIRITQEEVSMKIKFGQNMNSEERDNIRKILKARGKEIDLLTLRMMDKYNKD